MWLYLVSAGLIGIALLAFAFFFISQKLAQREPYGTFLGLRTRTKITFFRSLIGDSRVPRPVKVLPFLLVLYLLNPIDIIPDFIPVLGYLDDVGIAIGTLALIIRWTPRAVIDDLLRTLAQPESGSDYMP